MSSINTNTLSPIKTQLLTHLKLSCSFILSHPLYFPSFIFFFHQLFKFISFLSPLFITTSLLLVGVSTLLSVSVDDESEELFHLENLEAYRVLFEESIIMEVQESRVKLLEESLGNSIDVQPEKERRLEDFMKEVDEFEEMAFGYNNNNVEVEKVEVSGAKADKVVNSPIRNGSKGKGDNLGSFGSMRKEREWNRTLACKLYEDRQQSVNTSGEGMDLLWETYEMDTIKNKGIHDVSKKKKYTRKQYDEEEEMDVQLCCLQALKFSAGNMNSGNLMKISKAFKWLQNGSKHSKKVHNKDI